MTKTTRLRNIAMATTMLMASAVSVYAAPWSITGGVNYALPNLGANVGSFNPNVLNSGTGINELGPVFVADTLPAFPTVVRGGALNLLNNVASLTFTFFGREAGATNDAFNLNIGGLPILNTSSIVGISQFVTGPVGANSPLPFRFTSTFDGGTSVVNGQAGVGAQIAFLLSPINDAVAWAFFDDGGGSPAYKCKTGDCDFDDMIVRIEALAVPLPLPVFMLIGGMLGLGAVARRRRTQ